MFARINHLAICAEKYAINAFHQALFGMKARMCASGAPRRWAARSGLTTFRSRRTARRLDHFGFEVESIPPPSNG